MKHITFFKYFFAFLFFVTCFMFHVSDVFSQQISLSLSPPLIETTIKPGKSILVAYTLQNFGDPAVLRVHVLPFVPKDNKGDITIKDTFEGPIRFSLENADIQMDKPFFIRPQASQQILLRIRIPEGAPEQDYYYTLLAETDAPPSVEGKSASRAVAAIGSHILITTTQTGQTEITAKVSIFDVLRKYSLPFIGKLNIFDSNDIIPLVLIVSNNGKNLVKPQGEITLRGNFGEKATYSVLPQNILSESQRLLTATPSADMDCENSRDEACLVSTTLNLKGFFIGNYKLSTQIDFGDGTPILSAATSFIALPFKFMFGILVAIIIGVLIVIRVREKDSS